MNRYEFPFNLQCNTPTAVALGTFDGLHLAHCKVIEQAVASPYKSVVFAIEKTGKQATSLLQSEKKQALLESIGVSLFLAVPLDTICHLSPEEFFNTYLVEALQAKEIICGFNFRFGKDAAGDVALLEKLCKKAEIALQVTPPVTYEGQPISSTRVRAALQEGTPALATALLGRPFSFTATVIKGKQLGRTLGFPTINQEIPTGLMVPKTGVYAVLVEIEKKTYMGICNVGRHPTVGNLKTPLAETYILDFNGDVYGKEVTLSFVAYLRPEQTFPSLEELQKAIGQNAVQARQLLKELV